MFNVEISQRFSEVFYQKHLGEVPGEDLRREFLEVAEFCLNEGDFYSAFLIYGEELDDSEKVREIGERALKAGESYAARTAFIHLNDKSRMLKTIETFPNYDMDFLIPLVMKFFTNTKRNFAHEKFQDWAKQKGFESAYSFDSLDTANMAYNLRGKHDVGVGVARGGLSSSYIFNLFGLPVRIAEAHRKGKGATFSWRDEVDKEDFEGKRVVVFDKDVVSGRTTRRVLREIERYSPVSVDLVLNNNPNPLIGTRVENIFRGYGNVYFPKDFDYKKFGNVCSELERRLGID